MVKSLKGPYVKSNWLTINWKATWTWSFKVFKTIFTETVIIMNQKTCFMCNSLPFYNNFFW